MSKTMIKSFKIYLNLFQERSNKKILEIGSNDGSFIKNFQKQKVIELSHVQILKN